VPRTATAVVCALAVAAGLAFVVMTGDPLGPADQSSPPSTKVRTTSCSGTGARGPCAARSGSSNTSVAPGSPERIAIPAIGLHAAVASVVSTHEGGSWTIDPPKQTLAQLRRVYWWSEHAAPADPSTGAAYFYGHACIGLVCAFNDLHQVSRGDLVRVTTARGVLSYRVVTRPMRLAKTAAGIGSSSIYDYGVRDRLVLVTCGYTPDGSSPFNWVVIARLSGTTPTRQRG
jgi:hypothetical protein